MTEQYPVVVGVDGSDEARNAARWAAAVAEKLGVAVYVVHARPYSGHNPSDLVAAVRAASQAAAEPDEAILAAAADAIRADRPGVPLETVHISEPVDEVLVRLSKKAKLVVLGRDSVSVGAAVLVGSTTVAVTSRAECPVVAWRGGATAPTREPVVVGVTDDDDARAALATAFELADAFGVELVAVHSTHRSPGEDPRAVIAPLAQRYPAVGGRPRT
ncbi:universal stress protein, partial [Mycolicibacterium phlei]